MRREFALMAMLACSMILASCQKTAKTEVSPKPFEERVTEQTETTQTREMEGLKVTWIRDSKDAHVNPPELFDAPDSIIDALQLRNGLKASMSCFLVETEGKRILFDTGLGQEGSLLLPALESKGISPDSIDYVILTHLHGDHIGGMMANGERVFKNAKVYMSKREHDAWLNEMGDKDIHMQKELIEAYSSQLVLFEMGDSVPCGFLSMDAHGHTPGHTVFRKGRLLIIADLMHGAELQMKYPQYCPKYDMDPEAAAESRKKILEYARENSLLMAGMHLPEPGFIDMRD